jgi:predicted MFS family arabinose efflux permease
VSWFTRSASLAPFNVRNFRYLWFGDLLVSWAIEMEVLVLAWYVLVETGSVIMLTVFGALLYPGTLIAPMIGVISDRIGARNLLCAMRTVYVLLAAALMALALAGQINPFFVLLVAGLAGLIRPSDIAVRSTLTAQIVPIQQLMGAMGISRTTSESARIAGAIAGTGLFAALGLGFTFIVITIFYVVGLALTLVVSEQARIDTAGPQAPARMSAWRSLKEGMLYIWRTPHLLAGMWLAFLVNFTAFPLCIHLLPFVTREIYQAQQTTLGFLVASFAFGGLVGSIGLAITGTRIMSGRMMIIFAFAWYAVLLLFAHAVEPLTGATALMLAGLMQSLSLVPLTAMLLRGSHDTLRGRVMGIRMLAIYGLPLGLLMAGALIERVGFVATASLYATVGIVLTAAIAWRWRASLWARDGAANLRT